MQFRKFISLCALLALMLSQAALASHSAAHVDHGFSKQISSLHDHQHDHEPEHSKHECPECLLTQLLQVAFYNTPAELSFNNQALDLVVSSQFFDIALYKHKANSPRAPPSVLI